MIEGLQIEMKSDELKSHLKERGDYHVDRAELYAKKAENLEDDGIDLGSVSSLTISSDAKKMFEKKIKDHQDKASFYFFMAKHIIPDETYLLSERDLARIELASRFF